MTAIGLLIVIMFEYFFEKVPQYESFTFSYILVRDTLIKNERRFQIQEEMLKSQLEPEKIKNTMLHWKSEQDPYSRIDGVTLTIICLKNSHLKYDFCGFELNDSWTNSFLASKCLLALRPPGDSLFVLPHPFTRHFVWEGVYAGRVSANVQLFRADDCAQSVVVLQKPLQTTNDVVCELLRLRTEDVKKNNRMKMKTIHQREQIKIID